MEIILKPAVVYFGLMVIQNFFIKSQADESIAFSSQFEQGSTWLPFHMTGRSDKGFEAVTTGDNKGFKVCDVEKMKDPQNLLISRFIQPQDSVERIMLDIQYTLEGDKKNSNLKVGIVETNQPMNFNQYADTAFNTIKNSFGSNWLPLSDYLELELTKGQSGFHIAFLDLGACLSLQSMQIKYLFCPDMKANLTHFERTTVFVQPVQGRCVQNAKAESFPENNCKSSGLWRKATPDGDCKCDPGFEPDLGFQSCLKCPEDYYKVESGNERCKRCPSNSDRQPYMYNRMDTVATKCDCKTNYFRQQDETVHTPCTTVPSKPLDLRVEVKYTSFALSWRRPSYNGGRSDMFYEVSICPVVVSGSSSGVAVATLDSDCEPTLLRNDVTVFSATGFLSERRYSIRVCAKNGVSSQMRADEAERKSCELYAETTGKELRVDNLELIPERETIAIQWVEPQVPIDNPDLLNYSITVYLGAVVFSHVTTTKCRAAFSGLSSGEYTFSVVARYDGIKGPQTNLTQKIQGLGPNGRQMDLFSSPDPGVMLMIGVVVIVLLILVTIFISAVCILRRKHAEWEKGLGGGGQGLMGGAAGVMGGHRGAFMEYETSKAYPYLGYGSGSGASMPYDFTAVPVGQTFIDPHYYNLEEMMNEYTSQVDPHTIHLELPHDAIVLESGFFGCAGSYTSPDHFPSKHPVFVKMCKQKESDQFKELFFMEATILGQFNHPNVLQLHGVSLKSDPMMMVTEHSTGTFSDYLELIYAHQTVSNKLGGGGGGGADQQGVSFSLPPGQIVHQMRGVACGMQYLSELGYVHKVLCAKNILVSQNEVCKITGFDQRILLDQEQSLFGESGVSGELLPWSAPEVCSLRKFSTHSDSWSFGVTLWEIFAFPHQQRPYFGRTNQEIIRLIESGYRLPAPGNCPLILYELMKACWCDERNKRPDFALIQEQMHHMIRRQDLLQETVAAANMKSANSNLSPHNLQNNPSSGLNMSTLASTNYFTLPPSSTSGSLPITTSDWLMSIKLPQYSELFAKNNIITTEDILMSVDASVLEQMGVSSTKHRKKMMDAISKLKKQQHCANNISTTSSSSLTKQNIDLANNPQNCISLQTSPVFSEI